MRRTLVLLRFVVAIFTLSIFSVYAQSNPTSESVEARAWLKKIQSSAQRLNYSGTFVYQQGNQVRTSRITHVLSGRNELEKLEVLDGKPREYIRRNNKIVCYLPEAKMLLVEKRVTQDVFPAILAASPTSLAESYLITKAEAGRVAGFESQSILLTPKDNLRYGYKLWAEKKSGLLLRAQTINEKKEVVEQIAFAEITIGKIARGLVRPSYPDTRGWRIENTLMSHVNLSAWNVKSLPPGFKKVREVKRHLSDSTSDAATESAVIDASQREVSQIVFSDGLAAISVFIEPGSQSRTEGSIQQGAMNIVGKRQGDFWLTIVGEVPSAAIRQVANSIEFKANKIDP